SRMVRIARTRAFSSATRWYFGSIFTGSSVTAADGGAPVLSSITIASTGWSNGLSSTCAPARLYETSPALCCRESVSQTTTEVGWTWASIFSCGGMTSRTTCTQALSTSTLYKGVPKPSRASNNAVTPPMIVLRLAPRYTVPLMKALAIAMVAAATVTLVLSDVEGIAAQQPAKYAAPKTAWGDPDLQGTYTDKDENGIPMEKPQQFAGKSLQEVDDSELADIVRERQQRAAAGAAAIGGTDTGAGPVHWYEHYDAKNSRAWLVLDPP